MSDYGCLTSFVFTYVSGQLSAWELASTDYKGWTPHDIIRWLPTATGCFGPSKPWHHTVGGPIMSMMTFLTACRGTSTPWYLEDAISNIFKAFSASSPSDLAALFRVLPSTPIAFSNVQTERAWNPRHPTSTGNNQVFQPRTWHASFSSKILA